jgi:hypothetical protein
VRRRVEDHGDLTERGVGELLPAELDAVHARSDEVEQDDAGS